MTLTPSPAVLPPALPLALPQAPAGVADLRARGMTSVAGLATAPPLPAVVLLDGNKVCMLDALRLWPGAASLRALGLRDNRVVLLTPLAAAAAALEALDLTDNFATEAAVHALEPLPALRYLALAGNALTAFGLRDGFGALRTLTLDSNQLASLPVLDNLPALRVLTMDANRLGGGAGAGLPGAPFHERLRCGTLTALRLRSNAYADAAALRGGVLPALSVLDADDNCVADWGALASLAPSMQHLSLCGNRLGAAPVYAVPGGLGRAPQPLLTLPLLETLRIDGNGLASAEAVAGCRQLVRLYAAGNALVAAPRLDLTAASLRVLDLSYNRLTDAGLAPLRNLSGLAILRLRGNNVCHVASITAVLSASTHPHLREVDCSDNPATAAFYPSVDTLAAALHLDAASLSYQLPRGPLFVPSASVASWAARDDAAAAAASVTLQSAVPLHVRLAAGAVAHSGTLPPSDVAGLEGGDASATASAAVSLAAIDALFPLPSPAAAADRLSYRALMLLSLPPALTLLDGFVVDAEERALVQELAAGTSPDVAVAAASPPPPAAPPATPHLPPPQPPRPGHASPPLLRYAASSPSLLPAYGTPASPAAVRALSPPRASPLPPPPPPPPPVSEAEILAALAAPASTTVPVLPRLPPASSHADHLAASSARSAAPPSRAGTHAPAATTTARRVHSTTSLLPRRPPATAVVTSRTTQAAAPPIPPPAAARTALSGSTATARSRSSSRQRAPSASSRRVPPPARTVSRGGGGGSEDKLGKSATGGDAAAASAGFRDFLRGMQTRGRTAASPDVAVYMPEVPRWRRGEGEDGGDGGGDGGVAATYEEREAEAAAFSDMAPPRSPSPAKSWLLSGAAASTLLYPDRPVHALAAEETSAGSAIGLLTRTSPPPPPPALEDRYDTRRVPRSMSPVAAPVASSPPPPAPHAVAPPRSPHSATAGLLGAATVRSVADAVGAEAPPGVPPAGMPTSRAPPLEQSRGFSMSAVALGTLSPARAAVVRPWATLDDLPAQTAPAAGASLLRSGDGGEGGDGASAGAPQQYLSETRAAYTAKSREPSMPYYPRVSPTKRDPELMASTTPHAADEVGAFSTLRRPVSFTVSPPPVPWQPTGNGKPRTPRRAGSAACRDEATDAHARRHHDDHSGGGGGGGGGGGASGRGGVFGATARAGGGPRRRHCAVRVYLVGGVVHELRLRCEAAPLGSLAHGRRRRGGAASRLQRQPRRSAGVAAYGVGVPGCLPIRLPRCVLEAMAAAVMRSATTTATAVVVVLVAG